MAAQSDLFAGLAVGPGQEREAFRVLAGGGDLPALADLVASLLKRPEWMDEAACRRMDTRLFFPVRGESTKAAKAVCAGCLVQDQCLDYARSMDDLNPQGIWGGTSGRDRRKVGTTRDGNRLAAAAQPRARACRNCGAVGKIIGSGCCKACAGHFYRTGEDRPPEDQRRSTPRVNNWNQPLKVPDWPCLNCELAPPAHEFRCRACYRYFRRTGRDRPRELIDRGLQRETARGASVA